MALPLLPPTGAGVLKVTREEPGAGVDSLGSLIDDGAGGGGVSLAPSLPATRPAGLSFMLLDEIASLLPEFEELAIVRAVGMQAMRESLKETLEDKKPKNKHIKKQPERRVEAFHGGE